MAGEEWARRIVQNVLGRAVVINDDGSAPGMYDLRIGPRDAPEVAIECVGAVDPTFTETWNVGPAKGPFTLAISGDWIVEIAVTARVGVVKRDVELLLKELEARGICNLKVDYRLKRGDASLFDKLESLGITHTSCYNLQGSGQVHLGMPGSGGPVDEKGRAVPEWLGDFIRHPAREDVLSKLERSEAQERHAFIITTFGGTPWNVASYLNSGLDHVPSHAPDLPPSVTAAWITPDDGRRGLYWNGRIWRVVATCGEGLDD